MISIHPGNKRRLWWLIRLPWLCLAWCLGGCHGDSSAPFPEWVPTNPPATSGGAFSAYHQIGLEAELAVRGIEKRAAPTAAEIRELDRRLPPLMAKTEAANKLRVTDEYVPRASLDSDPARIGWTAIGRCYARRVRAAIAQGDFDSAVASAVAGTRFGLIIACGDASDALVGLPIVDEIRRMLTPTLRNLSPAQLSKLANGVAAALFDRLPQQAIAAHERLAMFGAIQAVQNDYRDGHMKALEDLLGPSVHESIETLASYRGSAESKRVAFFAAMSADAEDEAKWLNESMTIPASQRAKEPNPKPSPKKPWNALARQFILAGGPMISATDLTLARTRMLAICCQLLAETNTSGAAPRDLSTFPRQLNTDPYTGRSFYYVPVGLDFRLYSAGEDGVDNGGESDDAGLKPDLVLEGFG